MADKINTKPVVDEQTRKTDERFRVHAIEWSKRQMSLSLYDLAGNDERRRFSPFCWRTRLARLTMGWQSKRFLGVLRTRRRSCPQVRRKYPSWSMTASGSPILGQSPSIWNASILSDPPCLPAPKASPKSITPWRMDLWRQSFHLSRYILSVVHDKDVGYFPQKQGGMGWKVSGGLGRRSFFPNSGFSRESYALAGGSR